MLYVVQRRDGKPHETVTADGACTEGDWLVFYGPDRVQVATFPLAGVQKILTVTPAPVPLGSQESLALPIGRR